MLHLLPAQLPWWLVGPGLGGCVIALYGLANQRLGVSGAWLAAVVARTEGWRGERWRTEFLAALVAGALIAGLLGSSTHLTGYAELSARVPAGLLTPMLVLAGLALGYGARWAGGCTSGHGIAGIPTGSPDSIVATATFFAVAVATTFVCHIATGGVL